MKITKSVINAISDHARRQNPLEACGYLAQADGKVVHYYELTNMDEAHDHFAMDPREQFAAIRDMRNRGLKPAAVYHSHPETPARPSEEDIRLAYDPDIRYVIISLAAGVDTPDIRSFIIRHGKVTADPIEIVND